MPANMLIESGNLRDLAVPLIVGGLSGEIAAGSAGDVFAVRNVLQPLNAESGRQPVTRPLALTRLDVTLMGTALATPFPRGIAFFKASAFTVSASGGTAVLAQLKKTTGWAPVPSTEVDAQVAGVAQITSGTRTLAPQPFFVAIGGNAAEFAANSWWETGEGLPLAMEADEGIVAVLLGAITTGTLRVFIGAQCFRF